MELAGRLRYWIIKHLYQSFVSHQAQNGVQNHLGTDCAVCDEDAQSCKSLHYRNPIGEFFEITKIAHLEGFEKIVVLRWREFF